jgi:uncharacterized protein (DUF2062 family)
LPAPISKNPPLSATENFTITVNPLTLPQVSSVDWSNGQFEVQVSGQSGPDYEIQTSTNQTQWSTVFTTKSPAMPFIWQNVVATNAAGFYRVVVGLRRCRNTDALSSIRGVIRATPAWKRPFTRM